MGGIKEKEQEKCRKRIFFYLLTRSKKDGEIEELKECKNKKKRSSHFKLSFIPRNLLAKHSSYCLKEAVLTFCAGGSLPAFLADTGERVTL